MSRPVQWVRRRLFGLAFIFYAWNAYAIVTPFIDVDMGVVAAGQPTAVQGPGGDGILIFNKEDAPVRVCVTAVQPQTLKRAGTEAIPDAGWIQITPAEVVIAPHQKTICRMMVTIPAQKKFRGKTYEALVWTSILSSHQSGLHVLGTLQSRLRFTVK
jgi:hypothetical protein